MEKLKRRMLDPILKKELKLGARSIKLPLSVMFYDIVLSIIAVLAIFVASFSNGLIGGVDFSVFLSIYQIIGWTQMGIVLLIIPILSAGTISSEREKQTLEIMLTTPKKPISIVWGKLLASLSQYMIFILSSIPIMAIAFVLGGLNWFALIGYIFMMIVLAVFVGSIGVFCSSAFKKTIVSIVMTFLLEFALLALPIFLFFAIIAGGYTIHETLYYSYNNLNLTQPDLNFGVLPLIMIGSPLTGFYDYMIRSMSLDAATLAEIFKDADVFGVIMPVIAHAWIPLNVIACGGISYFFLRMAARKLNPVKNRKKKKGKHPMAGQPAAGMNPVPGQPMPGMNPVPGQPMPGMNPVPVQPMPGMNPVPGQPMPGVNPVPVQPMPGVNPVPGQPMPGVNPVPGQPMPGMNPVPEQPVQQITEQLMQPGVSAPPSDLQ